MHIKVNKKYILQACVIFLFFLFWNLFINILQNDEIWNYGFAHNIYSGLVPYKDFNMVITPFYPFLMSLPFHLFGSSLLVFHIVNAIMLTVFIFFVYHFVQDKIYIVVLFMMFVSDSLTFPTYNLLLLLLILWIMYLEKKQGNDYLIGILIALGILTKQSVGFFFLLPSFYYLKKDIKKFGKRIVGFMIPCFIFLIYLLGTHSFYSFFDQCLFGLLDFGEKNTASFGYGYILFIVYCIIACYFFQKNKHDICNYYVLFFAAMMVPLFDFGHSAVAYLILMIHFFTFTSFKTKIRFDYILYLSIIGIGSIMFFSYHKGYKIIYPNQLPHFEYRMIREDSLRFTNELIEYMELHPEHQYTFVVSGAYYFRLVTDTKISHLDLINYGNFGYHGTEKILKLIEKNRGSVFIVSEGDLLEGCQTDKTAVKYIMDHGEKIDSVQIYDFYVLKD